MVECLTQEQGGLEFEPHRRHCVVSLSKNINPSLVLNQPRKTCPFIIERLMMGRKDQIKQMVEIGVIFEIYSNCSSQALITSILFE